ncbi:MAG TPA: hypothetical protein VF574_05445 [Allosphingosinicella sp.]|jgi:hypothetical protein
MRIIFWLAAAVGAAAIGTAAQAQSGAGFARQGVGPAASSATGGGHLSGPGGFLVVRPGRGHDRPGRFGRRGRYPLYTYGGFGIGGSMETANPYGSGYFADGGRVRLRDGQPRYDYDRTYPYEWASAATGDDPWQEEAVPAPEPARCTLEKGVRVCRGGPSPVR